jgi:DNA-binding transcriptional regulator YdaS (Cro superfamily)|tara:strand:- start:260 stop:460 length:201 start_codon:yes stop_codon:yes gene_type:complete
MSKSIAAIDKAIAIFGSQKNLANRLDIPVTTLNTWARNKKIPASRAVAIALATNNEITVEQILLEK